MAAAHRHLRRVAAVHVRNRTATIGAETVPTSGPPACVVTFRRPNDVPFYITPPSHNIQAAWGEYTSAPICPVRDFAPWAWSQTPSLLVGLYACTQDHWSCIWEVEADLRTLPSFGSELSTVRDTRPNMVYLGLLSDASHAQLEYVLVNGHESQVPDAEEAGRRVVLLSMLETQMKQSYTFPQACSIVHVQGELSALRQKYHALQDRCGGALAHGGLHDKVSCTLIQRRQLEARCTVKDLRSTVHAQREALATSTSPTHTARSLLAQKRTGLQKRRANLDRGKKLLADLHRRQEQVSAAVATQSAHVADVQQAIQQHRVRLLRDLEYIYPIQLEDARKLLYSIAGLNLPNGVASTDSASSALPHKAQLEDTAAALAYVAQIVTLSSVYLYTNIPYPVRPIGSRAVALDGISVMNGQRTFALYGKGVEPYRYEYGVFLLNKDIEQLMNVHGVPVLDIRNTLPNVKNLLVTLASQ